MAAQSKLQGAEKQLSDILEKYIELARQRYKSTSNTTKLVSTVAFTAAIVFAGYGSYKSWSRSRSEAETGQKLLRRNSGLRGKDGKRIIYVPVGNRTARVEISSTKSTTFDAHRRLFLQAPRTTGLGDGSHLQVPPPQTKPGLNLAFLHQFLALMGIMVPRLRSHESYLLTAHAVLLFLRTYLSLLVARLDGAIVRDLVAGNGRAFLFGVAKWFVIGAGASATNAGIKYYQSKVSIAFRTRLTRYIHDLYLNDHKNYYKLITTDGGVGLQADQFITQDLTLFCAASASIYSSIGKPFVDLCVFNYQLYYALGPLAFGTLMSTYIATALALKKLSPPFGKLKETEGRKEGDFRALHSRLIANAEEVAFYGGDGMEKIFLDKGFKDLKRWMEGIYTLKIKYNMLEDIILKYTWSIIGYIASSLPVFLPAWGGKGGVSELLKVEGSGSRERSRMQDFITNKRLMLSLSDAGGRIMYSMKDLGELAGYTSRVYTLISTLHRVHADAYYPSIGARPELYSMADVQGTVHKGFDGVRLENVPVVAPALYPMGGDDLIPSLSFIVHSGEHLLITGSNGVGKSAISRIVAGLWPVYRGLVSRPKQRGMDGIMFLPQRPYLSTGTLRDQVIYPHTALDMKEAGRRDRDLLEILEEAKLGYLPDREGGFDTKKVWQDVLSGGEKQRMAIARLLYHEPRYAFVDEGTSAVSSDVEGLLYERCKAKGITLITISTRASLKRYHEYLLTLGLGDTGEEWDFARIGTATEKQSVEKELAELRQQLSQVEQWKKRRHEIENELNQVWVEGGEKLEEPAYLETTADSTNNNSQAVGHSKHEEVADGRREDVSRSLQSASSDPASSAMQDESAILDDSQASLISKASGEES